MNEVGKDWGPDVSWFKRKVSLNEDMLSAEAEDGLSAEEHSRRQREAEARARKHFIEYFKEHGEMALREKCTKLQERKEKIQAEETKLRTKQKALFRAFLSVGVLIDQYGEDAYCGQRHFTETRTYEHDVPDKNTPARWRRTEEALFAVTDEGSDVFRVSLDTTFGALGDRLIREYKLLHRPTR